MRAQSLPALSAAGALIVLIALGACSNSKTPCAAPSSGTFSLAVNSPQSLPVAIECEAGPSGATACSSEPPPFATAAWSVTVDGSTATVTSAEDGGASWSCEVTPPGTGCYLLVTCGPEPFGDAGSADLQIQILPPGSGDASGDLLVLVHQVTGECCSYSYSGTWQ